MKKNKTKKFILFQKFGGLGDTLQFSTLPEICHNKGIEFWLSDKNDYRNQGIYNLVWDKNPFVKGITNQTPNSKNIKSWKKLAKNIGHIERIELSQGFKPKNKCPKIYYKPKKIMKAKNKTLLDLGAISTTYNEKKLKSRLEYLLASLNVISADVLVINNNIKKRGIELNDFDKISTKNIFELCDYIYSCKYFITVFSGAAVLSSAIKNIKGASFEGYVFKPIFWNKRYFTFPNLNYIIIESRIEWILRVLMKRLIKI